MLQWRHWLCFALYVAISMVTGYLVNKHVPEPYMDEIFHIDQVQRYCRKEWGWYHPKLTTPPGLYVLSLPLTAFVGCEVTGLRFINQLLGMALYWVAACFTSEGDRLEPWTQPLTVLAAGVSPIGLFFHHLYYTDSASTLSVLLGVLLANRGHHWASALQFGLVSLTIRQTNFVWVVFCLVWSLCMRLVELSPETPDCRALMSPPQRSSEFVKVVLKPWVLLGLLRTHSVSLVLQVALPYGLVVISFALFLVVNGGVVLGDKANHVTGLHFPQLGYYLVYASAMLWPHFITASAPVSIYRALASILSTPRFAALLVGVLAVVTALVHNFTVHHPFLLSDNRHITFYVWKNFFRAHPLLPYFYGPLYVAAGWVWGVRVVQGSKRPLILWLGYAAAVALTLVPSPLLELRYFIPHLAFLRLRLMHTPSQFRILLELAFGLLLHSFILYRFIFKPFFWEGYPHEMQRLMW